MASVFDEYAQEVAQERVAEREKAAAIRLLKEGAGIELVAKVFPSLSIDEIQRLQKEELVNA